MGINEQDFSITGLGINVVCQYGRTLSVSHPVPSVMPIRQPKMWDV